MILLHLMYLLKSSSFKCRLWTLEESFSSLNELIDSNFIDLSFKNSSWLNTSWREDESPGDMGSSEVWEQLPATSVTEGAGSDSSVLTGWTPTFTDKSSTCTDNSLILSSCSCSLSRITSISLSYVDCISSRFWVFSNNKTTSCCKTEALLWPSLLPSIIRPVSTTMTQRKQYKAEQTSEFLSWAAINVGLTSTPAAGVLSLEWLKYYSLLIHTYFDKLAMSLQLQVIYISYRYIGLYIRTNTHNSSTNNRNERFRRLTEPFFMRWC